MEPPKPESVIETTVSTTEKKVAKIKGMIAEIDAIIHDALANVEKAAPILANIHPNYYKSACNLLHYRALRARDISKLQKKLGYMGLSRFAKSQSHVMASLKTNKAILQAILEQRPIDLPTNELSFKKGENRLKSNAKKLLGYRTKSRRTRIMVTMPSTAANDYEMVKNMLQAGMNCARVNCAHDGPVIWKKIIDHIRKASIELDKKCKIAMDLAGPKIRTGEIIEGPMIVKIRPKKDAYGRIKEPVNIWLGPLPKEELLHLPITEEELELIRAYTDLFFYDARNKKRRFNIIQNEADGCLLQCHKTTFIETGTPLYFDKTREGVAINIGELPNKETPLVLNTGDTLRLDKEPLLGEPAFYNDAGELLSKAHISCTSSAIFSQVKEGERILFDDGKITGVIKKINEESLSIKITHAAGGSAKLKAEKGINFPDTQLNINGLTAKDRQDLPFIVEHADVVNFSFVNRPEDVKELTMVLEELNALDKLGIVLKIETQSGYNQLTEILLEAMQAYPVGVMIARGDLAIETGWKNIGRVQEEILSLCQAAHITDIWATQVLENLAKTGIPSRSEITDTVMAQRADCVMLNKGPYILDAIQLLDTILTDMEPYWNKNEPMSPMMEVANIHTTE